MQRPNDMCYCIAYLMVATAAGIATEIILIIRLPILFTILGLGVCNFHETSQIRELGGDSGTVL
jgi:hypothetical protein